MSEEAFYPDDAGQSPHTALLGSQFVGWDETNADRDHALYREA